MDTTNWEEEAKRRGAALSKLLAENKQLKEDVKFLKEMLIFFKEIVERKRTV